jgi:hypothetical protein
MGAIIAGRDDAAEPPAVHHWLMGACHMQDQKQQLLLLSGLHLGLWRDQMR